MNSQEDLVEVIIPTYNAWEVLKSAIQSAYNQSYRKILITVVDNNSTDSTAEKISETFPSVNLIELQQNLGFVGAINIGVKQSNAKFIAFLNNDAYADKNWISKSVEILYERPEIVAVTPQIRRNNNSEIDSAGDMINIVGQAQSYGEGEAISEKFFISKYVFSASGCAPVYRKEIFDRIGLLENIFFAYFEDIDLSWRIQKYGFKIWYESTIIVWHYRKYTSSRMPYIDFLLFRNSILSYFINTPVSLFFVRKSLIKAILVFFHTIFWLLLNKKNSAGLKVAVWLLFNIGRILRLRNLRKKQNISNAYIDAWRYEKKLRIMNWKF